MNDTAQNPLLQAALAYLKRGWSVIPAHSANGERCTCGKSACNNAGKHPRILWTEYQKRLPTEVEVREWWRKWPTANIAILTGAISGIIVLDIDGAQGEATLSSNRYHLPPTPVNRTGGNGWHYLYQHPRRYCASVVFGPGVHIRADGASIIAPPSLHKSGRRYEWAISPDDLDPASPPNWFMNAIRQSERKGGRLNPKDWEDVIYESEHRRNIELTRRAGSLLSKRIPPTEVLTMLQAWNAEHCRPPLPEAELREIVASIAKAEAGKADKRTHFKPLPKYGVEVRA